MRARGFLFSRITYVFFAALLLGAPAAGQDLPPPSAATSQLPLHIELKPLDVPARHERARPRALMPMYGSLVTLQALDIHSTRRGMSSGKTREANPFMDGVVNNGPAFVAVKVAATAGAVWCAEKLRKKHPKGAVVFTVLVNATMAAVVTHNYRAVK